MRYGYILVGVASGALGATLGAIITKIVDKKKYDKRISEINDTMTAVKNRKKVKVLKSEEPTPETGVGASDIPEPAEADEDDSEEPKTEAEELVDHLGPYRPSEDHPYLITEAEFSANDGRNKISVFYYAGDDTAYDISGNEIDVEEDLGMSSGNLDEDRFTDSEEGVVYIRNHRKSEDYVVDLYPGVGGTEN
jgi:hypothetical protein